MGSTDIMVSFFSRSSNRSTSLIESRNPLRWECQHRIECVGCQNSEVDSVGLIGVTSLSPLSTESSNFFHPISLDITTSGAVSTRCPQSLEASSFFTVPSAVVVKEPPQVHLIDMLPHTGILPVPFTSPAFLYSPFLLEANQKARLKL